MSSWIESYRTLLDQWSMFSVRAELDIALTNAGCNSQPFQQVSVTIIVCIINLISCNQVFVCCHYCGKSISPWYKGMPKGGQTGSLSRQGGAGGNKPKVQACPHCKVSKVKVLIYGCELK